MSAKSFVYFVATVDEAMVKIGCSFSPEDRLAQLSCWSPYPLKTLAFVPGTPMDERAVHSRFIDQHSHREWFKSSPKMLSEIAAIARNGALPAAMRGSPNQPNLLAKKSSIRSSPEWRAKMSEIHTARCAIVKRERAVVRQAERYADGNHLSISLVNEKIGRCLIKNRLDGSHYFGGNGETLALAEKFFTSVSTSRAA